MKAASSDAINGFVHIEGKKISLGDHLQLVAGLRWTYKADRRRSRTWQGTIIHSRVGTSGSLPLTTNKPSEAIVRH